MLSASHVMDFFVNEFPGGGLGRVAFLQFPPRLFRNFRFGSTTHLPVARLIVFCHKITLPFPGPRPFFSIFARVSAAFCAASERSSAVCSRAASRACLERASELKVF